MNKGKRIEKRQPLVGRGGEEVISHLHNSHDFEENSRNPKSFACSANTMT
jgi:hypothetical protein